jgi:hypothetical protein
MLPNYASRNSGIPVSFDGSREDLYKICADPPSEPTTRSSRAEGLVPRLTGRAFGRGPGRSARSCPRLSAVLFSRCHLLGRRMACRHAAGCRRKKLTPSALSPSLIFLFCGRWNILRTSCTRRRARPADQRSEHTYTRFSVGPH